MRFMKERFCTKELSDRVRAHSRATFRCARAMSPHTFHTKILAISMEPQESDDTQNRPMHHAWPTYASATSMGKQHIASYF
jgi:hypothetical protein